MISGKFPRTRLCHLELRREKVRLRAVLVLAFDDEAFSVNELAREIFGRMEAAYFSTLRFAGRQKSYLLGRYAAKLALRELLLEPDLRAIEVVRGVFEQPIVQCDRGQGWDVTISHAGSLAAGLAYPAAHPMGIDVERIDANHYNTILSQLSESETRLIESGGPDKFRIATALWTAKEALSKVLTTGLMTPMRIYNLAGFQSMESGMWEGLFENFAQYKARAWVGSSYALSVALPKRSELELNDDLRTVL